MHGITGWSFAPYRPFLFDVGDIYICRIAPGQTDCRIQWLGDGAAHYDIYLRRESDIDYTIAASTAECSVTLTGLEPDVDYAFYITCGTKKSRERLFRTGESVGTVVNYLHPRDGAYSFSGQYLCSPSMVRHPDGYLLASMDVFGHATPQNLTLIFRSDDNGRTWRYVTELYPCFWGRLFIHRGCVYMLACSTEYGDLLIGKSEDGGQTFCAPTVLLRGSCKSNMPGIHKNPQPLLEHEGRLWGTLEWGAWAQGCHAPMVMSVDVNADLLDPASWHFTPPVVYDPAWPGVAQGKSTGNIEGTLAVAPDGLMYNIMRYDMSRTTPNWGMVLAYRVNTADPDAPLTYSHAINLPGNHSKFTIRRDDVTGQYLTIICRIRSSTHAHDRNLLSLMRSGDLTHWELVTDLIDRRHDDPNMVGFQYVDFMFDGNDLIYLCRTAMNGAHNFHDSNYQTFHRLPNFRDLIE